MDKHLLRLFNSTAASHPLWRACAVFGAKYLIVFLGVAAAFSAYRKRVVLSLIVAAGLAIALNYLISFVIFRNRPEAGEIVRLIAPPLSAKAFPSDHAAVAAVFAWTLVRTASPWGWLAVPIAFVVGFARVAVGVHYPSDVLAGFGVGTFAIFFVRWLIR